ncbi:unnamed protein product [Mycena citricolor]|uniref:Uncharacterized protein n=1 Tax=Mycena citricolor TaxID=2018698 RepID=A0AAD2HMU5_9AGAR|nr:unnamed protein product [Mycena citricolor]
MPIKEATAEEFKGLWQKLTNQTKKKEQGLHRASEVIQFFDSLDVNMSEHLWDAFFQTMDRLEEIGVPDDISAPSLPLFMAITEEDPTNDQCIQFETKWKKSQENDQALNAEMKRILKRTNRSTSRETEHPGYYPLRLSTIRIDWSGKKKQMVVDREWKCRTVEEILWLTKQYCERFWPKIAKDFYRRRPYCYGLTEFDDFDLRVSVALSPVAKLDNLVEFKNLMVLLDKSWVIRESSPTTNDAVSDQRCFGNIYAKADGTYLLKDFSGTILDARDLITKYEGKQLTIQTIGLEGKAKQEERTHAKVPKTLSDLLYIWSKQDQEDSGQYWFSVESPATSMRTASTPTLGAETPSVEDDHGVEVGSTTPTDQRTAIFKMPVPFIEDADPMFFSGAAPGSSYSITNKAKSEPSSYATSRWLAESAGREKQAVKDRARIGGAPGSLLSHASTEIGHLKDASKQLAEDTGISEPSPALGHAQSRAASGFGSSNNTSPPVEPSHASGSEEVLPIRYPEADVERGANVVDSNMTENPITPPEPAPAVREGWISWLKRKAFGGR